MMEEKEETTRTLLLTDMNEAIDDTMARLDKLEPIAKRASLLGGAAMVGVGIMGANMFLIMKTITKITQALGEDRNAIGSIIQMVQSPAFQQGVQNVQAPGANFSDVVDETANAMRAPVAKPAHGPSTTIPEDVAAAMASDPPIANMLRDEGI